MHKYQRAVLFASLAWLAAPAVLAHPHDDSEIRRWYLPAREARELFGTYTLSNGEDMKISYAEGRYWADMESTGRFEIVPVGPRAFMDTTGTIRFKFKPYSWPDEVTITGLPGHTQPVSTSSQ